MGVFLLLLYVLGRIYHLCLSVSDSMASKTYRFVPKRYGRGFVPVTWQGWLWTLLLICMILVAGIRNGIILFLPYDYTVDAGQTLSFLLDVFLIVMSNMWWMEKKCSDELRRRWGGK